MNHHLYPREPPPKVLGGNDIQSLAKYMKTDSCQNVFLMLGAGKGQLADSERLVEVWAGVSTSAGIPDFRSPETGLYANLARLNLPYPEAVFQLDFFRENPVPFYTLAKELYPGRYRPTITHSFIKVLEAHGLLHTCFTQNIDTLERRAGVSEKKIIEAHGSFATQRCIECKQSYPDERIKEAVFNSTIPRCQHCRGLIKPDIIFFGEALPPQFHSSVRSLRNADLLIVMGTSLTVHPFASLVDLVPDDCPRVLINLDEVGYFNKQDDVVLLGKCDEIVRKLCRELGWEEELDRAWAATADCVKVEEKRTVSETNMKVNEELDHISRDMEKSLAISKDTPIPGSSNSHSDGEETREPKERLVERTEKMEVEEGRSDPSVSGGKLWRWRIRNKTTT